MSVRVFFGALISVMGWMIALLTGGCTGFFLVQMLSDAVFGNPYVGISDIGLILVIGGLPFLIGLGMIKLGSVIRGNREE